MRQVEIEECGHCSHYLQNLPHGQLEMEVESNFYYNRSPGKCFCWELLIITFVKMNFL